MYGLSFDLEERESIVLRGGDDPATYDYYMKRRQALD